jgi:hypothetical protein
MLALLMKRLGVIDLVYPDEPEVRPAPESDKPESGISFQEVLASVERGAPKLHVESDSVDFGHGKKVSDY